MILKARFFLSQVAVSLPAALTHETTCKEAGHNSLLPRRQINNGAEKVKTCIRNPAVADPTAQNTLRAKFVIPLAYVRSLGLTIETM